MEKSETCTDEKPQEVAAVNKDKKDEGSDSDPKDTSLASDATGGLETSTNNASVDNEEKIMTKSQMKKKRRLERLMDKKKQKKERRKKVKLEKAIAQGRDIEKERQLQKEREASGEGHRRREKLWEEQMKSADSQFRICLDCSYEHLMTDKEIGSLASQIRYCYSSNRKSPNPAHYSVACLSGKTRKHLEKVAGFPDQWFTRAFACSKDENKDETVLDVHPDKSKLVYLTGDSDEVLEHLEDDKIYVIGGIVDRNRFKRLALDKAKELGITTARLPIDEHLKLSATKILTCNHTFEILLKYRELGNDWKEAMLDVLPQRKDASEVQTAKETDEKESSK